MSAERELEEILGGVRERMKERDTSIKNNDYQGERRADAKIVEGLKAAATACPANYPAAKKNFGEAAAKYKDCKSRDGRDVIIERIVRGVLIKTTIKLMLIGAGTLAISTLAAPGIMYAVDGTQFIGKEIDNGDGTHQFVYDSNNNNVIDSQITVSNEMGTSISAPDDSLGVIDIATNIWHMASSFLF